MMFHSPRSSVGNDTATSYYDSESYEHSPSQRRTSTCSSSRYTPSSFSIEKETRSSTPSRFTYPKPTTQSASSLGGMFSLLSTRHYVLLVIPGVLLSIIAGGLAPFMTFVIGEAFEAFALFSVTPVSEESKSTLLNSIGLSALELLGLAVGSCLLSFLTSRAWIQIGETITLALRQLVYTCVSRKPMSWFDTQVGSAGTEVATGSAGLMSQLAKESDDVRSATSLATGFLVQYLTTIITCLALAFQRSPILTLVILSTVPILVIIQACSQKFAGSFLASERSHLSQASSIVDRSVSQIATVKGFNAAFQEELSFRGVLSRIKKTIMSLAVVWSLSSGLAQFASMAMFVQAFWYGGKMVSEGRIRAGDVMAIFWACLIAMSNLQLCMPQLMTIAKGKFAYASLVNLAYGGDTESDTRSDGSARITPSYFSGEMNLKDVTFSYPSRPLVPVLKDLSIFIPSGETTFIVGGSGSGKSTVAQLLLSMYLPTEGFVSADRQVLQFLDPNWIRTNIACVSQTGVVFDMTIHENVALGVLAAGQNPKMVSRKEVMEACTAALLHDFIRELPQGYDTKLGPRGASLSGGQLQRLEIARALLKDPTVLILDEATSALDVTTRILVFEAIKQCRVNRTTIIVTHDLSSIQPKDFVYLLKDGTVCEQGFRADLESSSGEFQALLKSQKDLEKALLLPTASAGSSQTDLSSSVGSNFSRKSISTRLLRQASKISAHLRPTTMSNWMLDLTGDSTQQPYSYMTQFSDGIQPLHHPPSTPTSLVAAEGQIITPPAPTQKSSSPAGSLKDEPSIPLTPNETTLMTGRGVAARHNRPTDPPNRKLWTDSALKLPLDGSVGLGIPPSASRQGFFQLVRSMYEALPHKFAFFVALLVSLASGAMTPIFSFFLSRVMFEVSIGAPQLSIINIFGGITLGIAAFDGLLMGTKFFLMEAVGITWISQVQQVAYKLVLAQEKSWFDYSHHSSARIVQTLVKDAGDARDFPAMLGKGFVVLAMVSAGLVWAVTLGWQLTLAGLAIAPVFMAVIMLQAKFGSLQEQKTKAAKEAVASTFYDTITNIRAIRSMGLDGALSTNFNEATRQAFKAGVRSGSIEGIGYGCTSGLIYFAEALLFYVGAVLLANGTYSYLQMVQTLNLVIFTVTIGSQLMTFTSGLAKAIEATHAVTSMLLLPQDSDESHGSLHPKPMSSVGFRNVHFRYPTREGDLVLKGLTCDIHPGEHVAIVGSSGSGKSTVASLLQRLYRPSKGSIVVGGYDSSAVDIKYLRQNVTVVSQKAHIFDGTVTDNIAYGNPTLTRDEVKFAAQLAYVDDFISSLPDGYDTVLSGENDHGGTQISGGQAQRIEIARAMTRPVDKEDILILDECTSALDSSTQEGVCRSIREFRAGRTTIWITHKLSVMQGCCDRILVLDDGKVVEDGSYNDLIAAKGTFAKLASGGEWIE